MTTRKIELDFNVKGSAPRTSKSARKRRNRAARRRLAPSFRDLDRFNDTRRSSVGGSGGPLVSYASVPAGMGFQAPKTGTKWQVKGSGLGEIITISKCELWLNANVDTSELFTAPQAQAMIPATLPWLKGVAQNFSKWRWRRFCVKYTPITGTGTTGGVGRGFGYDMAEATPAAFGTVVPFDQFRFQSAWMADPDEGICADVGRFSRDWYPFIGTTAFNAIALKSDQNDYSPGYLSGYSSVSNLASTTVGVYWAEYVVELCDPISAVLQPN